MSQTAIGKGRIQKNSNEIRLLTKGARSEGEYNKGGEKFLTWVLLGLAQPLHQGKIAHLRKEGGGMLADGFCDQFVVIYP